MDIAVGDTILTRKKHPCGASSFEVLRVGMDFKIRCTGCGREVMLPRAKIEKNIKKVVKPRAGLAPGAARIRGGKAPEPFGCTNMNLSL